VSFLEEGYYHRVDLNCPALPGSEFPLLNVRKVHHADGGRVSAMEDVSRFSNFMETWETCLSLVSHDFNVDEVGIQLAEREVHSCHWPKIPQQGDNHPLTPLHIDPLYLPRKWWGGDATSFSISN